MSGKKIGGIDLLIEQLVECVTDRVSDISDDPIGDSPIEILLMTALRAMASVSATEYHFVQVCRDKAELERALSEQDPLTLVVEPQAQLDGWRVDFLIHAWEFGRISGRPQWRRLIVECDGHNWHERTRQQAARDRSRDREFQIRGYGVLRFTGSEIHNDPLGCAKQISEWGTMGW